MAGQVLPRDLPKTVKTILQPDINSTKLILTQTPLHLPTDPDDHLIKVHTASPCAGELLWARDYPSIVPADRLAIVCQDLSGVVISAPADSPFQPGSEVFARIPANRPGCACEYTLAKTSELALKPKTVNFLETAAIPISALTAWQGVFEQGSLDAAGLKGDEEARRKNGKQRILVTGAAGGVGSWIVQLASLAGAGAVVGLCGSGKEEVVRGLGATEVVNYREKTLEAWVTADPKTRECDLVVNCVDNALSGCWAVVKEGGVLISIAGDPESMRPEGNEKKLGKATWFLVEPRGSNLAEVAGLVDEGKLRPLIDSVWEMEEFEKAFERLEDGHAKGKVVIKIDGQV